MVRLAEITLLSAPDREPEAPTPFRKAAILLLALVMLASALGAIAAVRLRLADGPGASPATKAPAAAPPSHP